MRLLTSALLLATATTGCVVTDGHDSTLFVSNESDFEVHEMYITEVDNPSWGPNLLGADILLPGDVREVAIACNTYDAMLIDETGAACEVQAMDLCFDTADWVIRNNTCAVFEQRAAAMAAAK